MLITILVYLAAMVGIGAVLAKQNQTTDDFYLGGRTLGPLVTAMSAEASDMSSWLLMGLPGVAYLSGTADAAWTAIGLAIGTYVNWLVVAKRLRNYTHVCGNSTTLPLFFSNRYRDNKRILSVIAALLIIIFFVPYTASGFAACGKLFANLFGMDYLPAMLISAIVIVAYTTLGGFLAASTTDFVQSIVMTIADRCCIWFWYQQSRQFQCRYGQCKIHGRILQPDAHARCRYRNSFSLQPAADFLYTGMGTWIFRYASRTASFYGDR